MTEASALVPLILAVLVSINLLAFLLFGIDKSRARRGRRRIAERHLLGLAMLGGTPGTLAGRHVFRHKTRKQSFVWGLKLIALAQTALLLGWACWRGL